MARLNLSRRALLRGAGAAICLPWLEAMTPKVAHAAPGAGAPMRLGLFCFPFGVRLHSWAPTQFGANFTLPANLSALAPYKNRLVLTRGLGAWGAKQGSHMAATAYFATNPVENQYRVQSASADMKISAFIRQTTPSLQPLVIAPPEVKTQTPSGVYCHASSDGGCFEHSLSTVLSWVNESTPASQTVSPQVVFDQLFAKQMAPQGPATDPLVAFRRARGKSVLDAVLGQTQSLNDKLGTADRAKMDHYLTSLRDVERTIAAAPTVASTSPACTSPTRPGSGLPFEVELRAFMDLSVLAMACDRTRVVSHLLDGEANWPRNHAQAGAGGRTHHELSHYQENGTAAEYDKITAWYGAQLAYLIGKMTSFTEGSGDLLSNSVLVFGSGMGDGGYHDSLNLPIVIAGECGGTIQTGRAIDASGTRMDNLWLSIMKKFGLPDASHGNSNGALAL